MTYDGDIMDEAYAYAVMLMIAGKFRTNGKVRVT